jgi:hypothetical protein
MINCDPFTGFVVNINIKSRPHRDAGDYKLCEVIVIGDHKGGELVLVEPGLVIKLKSGNVVIFSSNLITHFNLHYKGVRMSIILNTDKVLEDYMIKMKGWNENKYFKSLSLSSETIVSS